MDGRRSILNSIVFRQSSIVQSISYANQAKSVRGRGGSALRAISRFGYPINVLDWALTAADLRQRPDDVSHHPMQERIRPNSKNYERAAFAYTAILHGPNRRAGFAHVVRPRCEIVRSNEIPR